MNCCLASKFVTKSQSKYEEPLLLFCLNIEPIWILSMFGPVCQPPARLKRMENLMAMVFPGFRLSGRTCLNSWTTWRANISLSFNSNSCNITNSNSNTSSNSSRNITNNNSCNSNSRTDSSSSQRRVGRMIRGKRVRRSARRPLRTIPRAGATAATTTDPGYSFF